MKTLLLIGSLGWVLISCDYSNKSNGNIDAAFREPTDSTGYVIKEEKENVDPANWIYRERRTGNNQDSLTGEQTFADQDTAKEASP
ncbi:MAG TPA: hypothetical protein VIK89_14325 [Cytophagaceae bacterium]